MTATAAGGMTGTAVASGAPGGRADAAAGPAVVAHGLTVLAAARWPAGPADSELPAIAGFVTSDFSPLAAAVAERCLAGYLGKPPADPALGERTAIVLASATGDLATAAAVASAVSQGKRVPPLLFFQSNPNAVAGYIAARWGLAGPVVCTLPAGDPLADAVRSAAALIEDGSAAAALVIVASTYRTGELDGVALLVSSEPWAGRPASRSNRTLSNSSASGGDRASPVSGLAPTAPEGTS